MSTSPLIAVAEVQPTEPKVGVRISGSAIDSPQEAWLALVMVMKIELTTRS
jgi:hypothetical protein